MHRLEWIVDRPLAFGAAPTWHSAEKRLYWSDLTSGTLFRLDPVTGEHQTCLEDGRPIGGLTVQADGTLLLFRDQANVVVWRDGEIVQTIINSIADFRRTQFTSAVAGPSGCVFCATQSDQQHPGRLLQLGLDGHLNLISDIFGRPAGMGFGPEATAFYFNDAHGTHLTTWRYDYDPVAARLTRRSTFRDGASMDDAGSPMGLTVDAGGNVWLSSWGGSAVMQCDAAGALLQRFTLPIMRPTGLCFGGENLDMLFMTSAGGHRRQLDGQHAGALARLTIPEVRGIPAYVSRIGLKAEAEAEILSDVETGTDADAAAGAGGDDVAGDRPLMDIAVAD